MPAMSPTMTEGNIASWKVNEGDSFSTGDVLLEIETDKAQMDVEAQEDGKLAKITQPAGTKGVKVGNRIAILAEEDDDLSSLELPAEDSSSSAGAKEADKAPAEPPSTDRTESSSSSETASKTKQTTPSSSNAQKQIYPLYPSVAQLLRENGLSSADADQIPASGPKGRLLKGDVLAHLGTIKASYASEQSARIAKLGHLDLSNIKAAPPPSKPKEEKRADSNIASVSEPREVEEEVAVPITLTAALSVQRRLRETLGIDLPLSTFIARAAELSNEDLPRNAQEKLSAEQLFDDIVGIKQSHRSQTRRGSFIPQITALTPVDTALKGPPASSPDIYDILSGSAQSRKTQRPSARAVTLSQEASTAKMADTSIFSVTAPNGEAKRARIFLERMKTILQVEPGRLIV